MWSPWYPRERRFDLHRCWKSVIEVLVNDVSLRSGPSGDTRCQRLYKFSGAQLCDAKEMRLWCHGTERCTHHPGQRPVLVKERPGERWSVRHVGSEWMCGWQRASQVTTYTLLLSNFSRFPWAARSSQARERSRAQRKLRVERAHIGIHLCFMLHAPSPSRIPHGQHAPLTPPYRKVMSILPAVRNSHVCRGSYIGD